MDINEIVYMYYGDKCLMLQGILEQIELKNSNDKNVNMIYIEKRMESLEEIIENGATVIPVVKQNDIIIEATGEKKCVECSEKYGFEVSHKIYGKETTEVTHEICSKIGNKNIVKILTYKECNKNGCCGNCGKKH